jgi:hypothetical protein
LLPSVGDAAAVVDEEATGAGEFVRCLMMARTVNSSPEKSAPGSSKDSAVSVSSTSTTGDWVSFRPAVNCSREVSGSSDSVTGRWPCLLLSHFLGCSDRHPPGSGGRVTPLWSGVLWLTFWGGEGIASRQVRLDTLPLPLSLSLSGLFRSVPVSRMRSVPMSVFGLASVL